MGLFGGGHAHTISLKPFMNAAAEANKKGTGVIADFESVANDFAAMGQANYNEATEMFGSWKYIMDDYYSALNPNEFGAQAQQQILQQQEQQLNAVKETMSAGGVNPDSAFMIDMADQVGQQGLGMMSQSQVDSKYQVASMQQNWANYGQQQIANDFNIYQTGVGLQGQQANSYANMYAGQAANAMRLANQQAQYNNAAKAASKSHTGSALGSLAGLGIGMALAYPTGGMSMGMGGMIGMGAGGAAGGLMDAS